jgi:Fe-S oxidoreductase
MAPTQFLAGKIALVLMLAAGLGVFAWSAYRRTRLLLAGQPVNRFDRLGERLWGVVTIALGQSKMFKYPLAGLMHALIFWGFCVFSVRTLTLFAQGLSNDFVFPILGWWNPLWGSYLLSKDVFAVLVSVGALFWILWRLLGNPRRISTHWEAYFILGLILTLMLTDLVIDGTEIAYGRRHAAAEHALTWQAAWLPFSSLVAGLVGGASDPALRLLHDASWWLHMAVLLVFLNFLPYGKHFHVITSIPNTFFRNLGPAGRLPRIPNIEEAEHYGFSKIEHFDWKDVLDAYTCTECGRCSASCPATLTFKPLSPKHLSLNLRDQLYGLEVQLLAARNGGNGNAGRPDLVHDVITPDVLWDCTSCRACEEQCPVSIEFVDKIVQMRRHLVLELSEFPAEVTGTFQGLETHMNPYGMPAHEREDWAQGLDVPIMSDVREADVLYWVGCAGSFDERNKKISRSLVRILKKAGVSFAILGNEEACTGDPARRIGNEYLFEVLAQQNVETLKQYKFQKIVTNCPHCFNTLKNEYPDFGAHFEVIHTTELVASLISSGKIKPDETMDRRVVFHDSCYLGRYNDVYERPRQILDAIPGMKREDVELSRTKGMCCGAGGGRMWMEETRGERINQTRVEQLMAARPGGEAPQIIASACPFCMTMLEDGVKTTNRDAQVQTYDVLELLDQSLSK